MPHLTYVAIIQYYVKICILIRCIEISDYVA